MHKYSNIHNLPCYIHTLLNFTSKGELNAMGLYTVDISSLRGLLSTCINLCIRLIKSI